jgi:hypothetical protein
MRQKRPIRCLFDRCCCMLGTSSILTDMLAGPRCVQYCTRPPACAGINPIVSDDCPITPSDVTWHHELNIVIDNKKLQRSSKLSLPAASFPRGPAVQVQQCSNIHLQICCISPGIRPGLVQTQHNPNVTPRHARCSAVGAYKMTYHWPHSCDGADELEGHTTQFHQHSHACACAQE